MAFAPDLSSSRRHLLNAVRNPNKVAPFQMNFVGSSWTKLAVVGQPSSILVLTKFQPSCNLDDVRGLVAFVTTS